jgi:hypothetical protein
MSVPETTDGGTATTVEILLAGTVIDIGTFAANGDRVR